jgi:hypothetical protein
MKSRLPDCRLQLIVKRKSWPSSDRSLPSTVTKMPVVSLIFPYETCGDHTIVVVDEEDIDELDVESQDDEDVGYGARPGGGFTSVVSIQTRITALTLN